MKTLIIYGSQYGSTKRYAERLAEIAWFKTQGYDVAATFKSLKNAGIGTQCRSKSHA